MILHTVKTTIPVRLDRYLARLYPNLTQGILQKSLRLGLIKVNDKKSSANLRLVDADLVSIDNEKLTLQYSHSSQQYFSQPVISLAGKILNDYLIFDNEDFMAINKPIGLATQGGSKINLSIDEALCYLNKNGYDLRLVHRLDKETSGVLLIAKNYLASTKLTKAFEQKQIHKTYIAVTFGIPAKPRGEVSCLIGKNREGAFEIVKEDALNGKIAITKYKVLKTMGNCAVIKFIPLTGRTHQIRFHARYLNCPIIGDHKYGNAQSTTLSKNMLLHASNVLLDKDIFGITIKIQAELPSYFKGQ
jgi:23S rRNA pseudouridine955/2504/2580 synthase